MEERIKKQQLAIEALYKEKLLPVFFKKITVHQSTMQKIALLQDTLITTASSQIDKETATIVLNTYKTSLETVVTTYFANLELEKEKVFDDYYSALDTHTEGLEDTIKRIQEKERFLSLDSDTSILKFRKKMKLGLFHVAKLPLKFANIFRKSKKEVLYWSHEIPYKNVTAYYFKSDFTTNLSTVIDTVYKEISEVTEAYWLVDTKIDDAITQFLEHKTALVFPEEIQANLNELPTLETRLEHVANAVSAVYETTAKAYEDALYKADTIELSATFFSTQKIAQYQKVVLEKTIKDTKLWQNTFYILESDWELDIEIFKIIFHMIFKFNDLETSLEKRTQPIYKELEGIASYLREVKETVSDAKDTAEIKATISKELKRFKKDFKSIIHETTTLVNNQELPVQINQFEENALTVLDSLSRKRVISADTDYGTKTASSAINFISPFELITYQSWPSLASVIKQAKLELQQNITTFIDDIAALSQVSEFNLESALSLFEKEASENTPKNVAIEGLTRSEEKIEVIKHALETLKLANANLLIPSIDTFIKSILELTDTENITEIRLTIAKAKSIEKSKLLKEKIVNVVKNFIPVAFLFITTKYTSIAAYVKKLLLRAGLYKEHSGETADLADFLKQAEQALGALPYVYQRLFRSETLQNENLFIGRVEALTTLQAAGDRFVKNQFSASVIIGERGSGKTSLIHHFLNQNKKIPKATFLSSTQTISEVDALITFLNTSFHQNIESLEAWIAFFNSGKKRTIVIEDIQYFYFREVGGFKVLHALSNLISATKNNVFWLVTCSKYAFQYLEKSIQLSEIFAFKVAMNEIDKETIKQALTKRHKISGYNLYFEQPPMVYLSKKFLKSNIESQQEILKEEFFSDINKIAQSNFKIAFMYWIRSTQKVSGSTIYMRSLKSIDTSFLSDLAPTKLLLLNSILLHEKLKLPAIISLSSLSEQQTKNSVSSLFEKGLLIIDEDEFYSINIFLYRQITTLLKSKNIIH